MLAISFDPVERSAELARAWDLDFPLLADTEGALSDAFGVRHVGGSPFGGDIARPAVFVLDRDGRIVWRELTENWRVRVRPDEVIDRLRQIP